MMAEIAFNVRWVLYITIDSTLHAKFTMYSPLPSRVSPVPQIARSFTAPHHLQTHNFSLTSNVSTTSPSEFSLGLSKSATCLLLSSASLTFATFRGRTPPVAPLSSNKKSTVSSGMPRVSGKKQ
jgi:hypothetical protein